MPLLEEPQLRSADAPDVRLPVTVDGSLWPLNAAGFLIIAGSFVPALVICYLIGDNRDGMKLAIGGPLALAADLVYRLTIRDGHWLVPTAGGKFLFLPVWVFGVFWTIYGVCQIV
jgi:hypothetical protein